MDALSLMSAIFACSAGVFGVAGSVLSAPLRPSYAQGMSELFGSLKSLNDALSKFGNSVLDEIKEHGGLHSKERNVELYVAFENLVGSSKCVAARLETTNATDLSQDTQTTARARVLFLCAIVFSLVSLGIQVGVLLSREPSTPPAQSATTSMDLP